MAEFADALLQWRVTVGSAMLIETNKPYSTELLQPGTIITEDLVKTVCTLAFVLNHLDVKADLGLGTLAFAWWEPKVMQAKNDIHAAHALCTNLGPVNILSQCLPNPIIPRSRDECSGIMHCIIIAYATLFTNNCRMLPESNRMMATKPLSQHAAFSQYDASPYHYGIKALFLWDTTK